MSDLPLWIVDAFTDRPFSGNPAAVCLLSSTAPDSWLQAVANEMNLSETAFLLRDGNDWGLRWLTPTVEVDLCGHATLAAAHVLFQNGMATTNVIRFQTRSGLLTAERIGSQIALNFPSLPVTSIDPEPWITEALGAEVLFAGDTGMCHLYELSSEICVRQLSPDLTRLKSLPTRGIIVTSRADSGTEYDFVSRFFAPALGVDEDPVTGSAHCALAPYWHARLGKTNLRAYQASARGGSLDLTVLGDRIELRGSAVTMLKGSWIALPGAG